MSGLQEMKRQKKKGRKEADERGKVAKGVREEKCSEKFLQHVFSSPVYSALLCWTLFCSFLLHFLLDSLQIMFVDQPGGCDVVRAAMALHPGTEVVAFGLALLNVVSVCQEKYDDMKDVRI
jgi:hypothetical protein